jgi:hypothetical protein
LVNYELERIANQTYGNDEFKQSVKNYVPEGYTFKGYPLHTVEIDYDKMFGGLLSSDVILKFLKKDWQRYPIHTW